ncbi:MAG TPA: PBP1A family penicillin-binding protein [bacterium]|nr:PBP1A family penicillin-binding protein [bacterium]
MKRRIRATEKQFSKPENSFTHSGRKWAILLLLLLGGVIFLTMLFIYLIQGLPPLDELEHYSPELATKIYSQDGVIIKELFTKKRSLRQLNEISDYMVQAVLATEDRDFYSHWGINSKRLAKAILVDILHFRFKEGASTLTQQLARQLYLTLEKSIIRKIREAITAIQIERTYTKPEILSMYLNHMYFGHGAYGVQTAAQRYFNKDAIDLNLVECALLTGVLASPTTFSPYRFYDRILQRRNLVLHNMYTQGYISEEEYLLARSEPIVVVDSDKRLEFGIAPYFTEHIRQRLQQSYKMNLYTAGLNVYSTLDTRLQSAAERAVEAQLNKLQSSFNERLIATGKIRNYLPDSLAKIPIPQLKKNQPGLLDSIATSNFTMQVAFVALDPNNGNVLAMIGGRDFEESKYNRAVQMRTRQPGSTFKPIVYTAAIDNGYPPSFELLNQPVVLYLPSGDRWAPHNYDRSQGGPTTLREGLRRSLNLVTARLVQEVVPPRTVVDYARKLGLTTDLPVVDAIALGSGSVSPIELTSAFGVFANQGILAKPLFYSQVVDKSNNILEEHQPEVREVLRKETAFIMTDLLQTVVNRGTGASARSVYNFRHPAGGKTGTTNDYTDAWFVGFTKHIVAGVWVGFDDPMKSLGPNQAGAVVALPIWANFMKTAHDTLQLPPTPFKMPAGVIRLEICRETKKLATEFCPEIMSEIFEVKTAPNQLCDKHTGLLKESNVNRGERKRF